jgi:hypothetical protein
MLHTHAHVYAHMYVCVLVHVCTYTPVCICLYYIALLSLHVCIMCAHAQVTDIATLEDAVGRAAKKRKKN